MTPRKRTVVREPAPAPALHPTVELKKLLDGQLGSAGDLRERVTALESESKHYATRTDLARLESESKHYAMKADLANMKVWALAGIASALLSVAMGLAIVLVRVVAGN